MGVSNEKRCNKSGAKSTFKKGGAKGRAKGRAKSGASWDGGISLYRFAPLFQKWMIKID